MEMTIDSEIIQLMTDDERVEYYMNAARKDFTESEYAEQHLHWKDKLSKYTQQGKRTDLMSNTSIRDQTQVNKPTLKKVAELFHVSPDTVHKRITVLEAINKNPKKYAELKKRWDSGKTTTNTAYAITTQFQRSLPIAPLPKNKFDVFICDIPEKFKRGPTARGSSDRHYKTMTPEKLVKGIFDGQDIRTIFADNAVIYLWISTAFQYFEIPYDYYIEKLKTTVTISTPTYAAILHSWGFHTITAEFMWEKDKIGMGVSSRNQHEKCLMAIKGHMPRPAKLFPTIIKAPRTKHSEKPLLHKMAEAMWPKRNYCELFAIPKIRRPGWTYWGNQVNKHEKEAAIVA